MQNSAKELEICQKLKPLENKIFNTKTALFDALADAGVQLTKGYRTGSNNKKNAETFIIDFNKDVYGKFITVELLDFIRYEQKFESIEILKKQLAVDIKTAKEKAKYYKNVTK